MLSRRNVDRLTIFDHYVRSNVGEIMLKKQSIEWYREKLENAVSLFSPILDPTMETLCEYEVRDDDDEIEIDKEDDESSSDAEQSSDDEIPSDDEKSSDNEVAESKDNS